MHHPNQNKTNQSVALLIDADNAPAAKIEFIIGELATQGAVNIRRAYGNWKKRSLVGWEKVLHEYAIQPIQHFDLVKGKNATDMALLIDAMDILYTKNVHTFCLVSSDCDFTPLVHRLRSEGKQVIGFGRQSTPSPFVNACTKFIFLEDEAPPQSEKAQQTISVNKLKQNTKLMNTLRKAVKAATDESGWASLGPVGSHISNQGPFDHRTYGFRKLSDMFAAIDLFDVKTSTSDGQPRLRVRIKKQTES
ncbi:NYN domain-containing protein [Verrucomicrobiaceae bacterium N1E253]|uniref:NYN domain-containing protein n=1 Tax=Oceaniferula marina TaxID=2748318 RepID=A0A851GJA4_9BACT|nr:NYN domain-containing protein [Oceaniferula marina]NWK54750.1 NYN domain-containing protein [Oceaniferula marina]